MKRSSPTPIPHCDRSASESGQGALELALSLPVFVLLILASAEIGNFAWASVQINNAARAGAAFASLSRANAADITDIRTAAYNEAPRFITAPSTQVTSNQVCSCVDTSGSPSSIICDQNALTNCASPKTIQVFAQVNIQVPIAPIIHYPGLPASYTLNAQATVGVEQ